MKAAALQVKAYNKTLRTESVLYDVFETLSGEIRTDPKGTTIPEAVFLKSDAPPKGAHSVVLALLKSLSGAPQMGTSENMLGNEENLKLKHLTIYYNEIKKSVASFGWGIDFNDLSYLDVYGQITPLMTRYFAELRGRRIREALLLTYASELTKEPLLLKQQFNPNVFVTNTVFGSQPSYARKDLAMGRNAAVAEDDGVWPHNSAGESVGGGLYNGHYKDVSTYQYFVLNIYNALAAATNTSADFDTPAKMNMTVEMLLALSNYVEDELLLDPLMIDGQPSYIFLIPSTTAVWLSGFSTTNSRLGDIWKDVSALSKKEQDIPCVLGRVNNLVLVKDSRYPTLTVGGTSVNPTLTPGFMAPGRADGRNKAAYNSSSNKVFQVGFVLGKGALIEWVANDLKYATEQTEYGKFQGKGAYQMAGIQLVKFDEDALDATGPGQSDTSYQQNSSCVVLMTTPQLVTHT
jgi:hypothetical protein